jgi:glucans biosynthesis protein
MLATATGEWIWRPLTNPKSLLVNSFQVNNPVGFGLSQRDLDFDHYQDLESNHENRPSLWISPVGNWGEGRVELIQIPTDKEIYDNIVAFFVPSRLPGQGEPLSFAYQMVWHYATESPRPPAGRVIATRVARTKVEGGRKFVVDFAGTQLDSLPADKPVEGVVTVGPGVKFMEQQVFKTGSPAAAPRVSDATMRLAAAKDAEADPRARLLKLEKMFYGLSYAHERRPSGCRKVLH